ncbi:unnamed protein product [Echinostoma caproni]|uniref:TPR_REGION domain-containing protein n=1 Tax=Echinostoma caproni TaxID=27848 RepID=A0A183BDZ8_9TREM|nr:unnamed protein product [Echinostoma caproni]
MLPDISTETWNGPGEDNLKGDPGAVKSYSTTKKTSTVASKGLIIALLCIVDAGVSDPKATHESPNQSPGKPKRHSIAAKKEVNPSQMTENTPPREHVQSPGTTIEKSQTKPQPGEKDLEHSSNENEESDHPSKNTNDEKETADKETDSSQPPKASGAQRIYEEGLKLMDEADTHAQARKL